METLQDDKLEKLMGLSQRLIVQANGDTSFRRDTVKSEKQGIEEDIFVLSTFWGVSRDGDRFWVETSRDNWTYFDAYDIMKADANVFIALIQARL